MSSPTLIGSLSAFLQSKWSLAAPLAAANIHWNEFWFNPKKIEYPQVTISDLTSDVLQRYTKPGTTTIMYIKYRPLYVVNVWHKIDVGSSFGTQQANYAEDMRREVAWCFRDGITNNYGGSLGPFGVVLPLDMGRPLHELKTQPRILRYEITLVSTVDDEA